MPSEGTKQLLTLLGGLWCELPDAVKAEADAQWPRGSHGWLGWPTSQVMVIPSRRLLYVPIAKNACSTLKRMMLGLAGYSPASSIYAHVHECLDFYETGLQLKDWPAADVERFLTEPDWFRFAVLRDPLERLVSAYREKFVRNRLAPGNQVHTAPVVRAVQGVDRPDLDRGITFRAFADYVAAMPAEQLDPHWRPQMSCLPQHCIGLQRFNADELDALQSNLGSWCGVMPSLGHHNAAGVSSFVRVSGCPADQLPAQLDGGPVPPWQAFIDAAIADRLLDYNNR